MRKPWLLIAVVLVAGVSACRTPSPPGPAESSRAIYKWIDENGVAHYTTDRERIPRRLRDRIPATDEALAPAARTATPSHTAASPGAAPGAARQPAISDDAEQAAIADYAEQAAAAGRAEQAASAGEEWVIRDRLPDPAQLADARSPVDGATRGRMRADLDARIARLETEIASDEEVLKSRLGAPGGGEFTLTADAELRSIAERLPRRLADLRALRAQRGKLEAR